MPQTKSTQTENTGMNQTGNTGDSAPVNTQTSRNAWDVMGVSLDDLPVIETEKKDVTSGKETPPKNTPEASSEKQDNTTDTSSKTDSQPKGEKEASTASIFAATNGKKFDTADNLLKAYNESSTEGQRLAKELRVQKTMINDLESKLSEANQTLLSLQEHISSSGSFPKPFPEPSKPIEEMTKEEKMAYEDLKMDWYAEKRDWKQKQSAFKTQMENAKKESEEYAKKIRMEMDNFEKEMSADSEAYPDFEVLKPLREHILQKTPWLDNRPDTPYLSYLIAYGLVSLGVVKKANEKSAQAKSEAAAKTGADSQAAGGTGAPATSGSGGKQTSEDTELNKIVTTYQERTTL